MRWKWVPLGSITVFGIGSLIAALATSANAAMLTLTSQNAGQYNYGIQLAPNQGLVFFVDNQITLSGISDVRGATLLSGLSAFFGTPVTTATSVTITDMNPIVFDPTPSGVTIPAFSVTSLMLTTGSAQYVIETPVVAFVGTVPGPVAVPEPRGLTSGVIGVTVLLIVWRAFRLDRPVPFG